MTPSVVLRRLLGPLVVTVLAALLVPSALGSPSDTYAGPHTGDGRLPAECIVDRDPINPDNRCYHLKVGLNALDSPKVDVVVLIPVSPASERDMRIAVQSVQMWEDGIKHLATQMDLPWLADGLEMDVRSLLVGVDGDGLPTNPIELVDPEIVVVVSNPAGGIGIGIDPTAFAGELGIVDDQGLPCADLPNPFSLPEWQARDGFQQHNAEPGGVYVEDCGGAGGNVCFAVNGAVDPVPGLSDFFGLYDLVSHEFGHCLTIGHVGDGADGPWGPTATNDIMAYSTDPPLLAKCVSSLDVEGFALRMSRYLDVNGDGKVDERDHLTPNDVEGDGMNSFQVQHPADHFYASSTGDPDDCPQPDFSLVPGAVGDFSPTPVATTRPKLSLGKVTRKGSKLKVRGVARHLPKGKQPTAYAGGGADAGGDSVSPITDIQDVRVAVSRTTVDATVKVGKVWPLLQGTSLVAYSLTVDGRRFDSFIPTGGTDGQPVTLDNGTGYLMPPGTTTWDTGNDTVTFRIRRDYLSDQGLTAPYNVYAVTGYHARTNDWLANDDVAPDQRDLDLAGPRLGPETRDAPVAKRERTTTYRAAEGSFAPTDSTLGVSLVSVVESRDQVPIDVPQQSSALVTLTWEGDGFLGLTVGGGSSQRVIETDEPNTVQVLVPWSRRDLTAVVDPQEILGPVDYTLTVQRTTVVKDRDGDRVPDVADQCATAKGPSTGAGCPDTDRDTVFDKHDSCRKVPGTGVDGCPERGDEKVVAFLDGKKVDVDRVMTARGEYTFVLKGRVKPGRHTLKVTWFEGDKVVRTVTRKIR